MRGNIHVTVYLHISHWKLCCKASCCCSLRQSLPAALLNQQANFLFPYQSVTASNKLNTSFERYQH